MKLLAGLCSSHGAQRRIRFFVFCSFWCLHCLVPCSEEFNLPQREVRPLPSVPSRSPPLNPWNVISDKIILVYLEALGQLASSSATQGGALGSQGIS